MPTLGLKKKDLSKVDKPNGSIPQLSNEKQLSIMHMVRNGQMSIEDALDEARKETEEQQPSQFNFTVHKHNRYRWQKRVLQIDFKTKMLCSIEKGIIKRQFAFLLVKSCDDGVGCRFTISFKEHHDYELESTSLVDKHKIMELLNKIIYENIYQGCEDGDAELKEQLEPSKNIKEGFLLLHRGGLASFKWVKYKVHLQRGQLSLFPQRHGPTTVSDEASLGPVSTVIHLSDGDTSVQKQFTSDTFTLITHKNEYLFKLPSSGEAASAVQKQRDDWVKTIHKLCSHWKRRSRCERLLQTFHPTSITEDTDSDSDPEAGAGFVSPPKESAVSHPSSSAGDKSPESRSTGVEPVPEPPFFGLVPLSPRAAQEPPSGPHFSGLVSLSPEPGRPVPPSPSSFGAQPGGTSLVKKLPNLVVPPPPPLPVKRNSLKTNRTKAFHWDQIPPDKISKSFWSQEKSRKCDILSLRLYEQFSEKDLGPAGALDQNHSQNIMLNQKIAHNFNIFLKSFPVPPEELQDKLLVIREQDGGLSDEHISSLRRYVPTPDDVEMYKLYKGAVSELHVVDQYMLEMCNIPSLNTQLDLLLTLRELPISINDLQPLIQQKITMCRQLSDCSSFLSVLDFLLAIGNFLNENAGKDKVKGFRLSTLTKLSQLRGRTRNFTLLHALVDQITLKQPSLLTFTQELGEFETVPGASIKGLTAEVDALKNELQKVKQYKKTYKKRNIAAQNPNFSKDLKTVIETYNVELEALMKSCDEMKKLYSIILVKFGEAADQDSQELFGVISQFLHDFKKAHAENTTQL